MAHYRTALRTALMTRLTGLVTTGSRVFIARDDAMRTAELPSLVIGIEEPDIITTTVHTSPTMEREVSVTVKGYASTTSDVDLTLNNIGEEVEIALGTPLTVVGIEVSLGLRNVSMETEQADKQSGLITMSYSTKVFTAAGNPGALL